MTIEVVIARSRDLEKYGRLDAAFHVALAAARRGILPDVPEEDVWMKVDEAERKLIIACWVEFGLAEEFRERFTLATATIHTP